MASPLQKELREFAGVMQQAERIRVRLKQRYGLTDPMIGRWVQGYNKPRAFRGPYGKLAASARLAQQRLGGNERTSF
jgi:hypothetical protein